MLAGAALAFYALIGFEDSVNVAEETQDPVETYPQVLFAGLAIAGVLYFLVTVGASRSCRSKTSSPPAARCSRWSSRGRSAINEKVFSAIGLLALSNGALINMIMASRLLYGMAKRGRRAGPLGTVAAPAGRHGWRSCSRPRSPRC